MTPPEIYKAIGNVIRLRRKQFKLTQQKLAPLVGMSRTSLANIESGRQNLLVHHLFNFASVLEIEPADLLPAITHIGEKQERDNAILLPKKGLNKKQRGQILNVMSDRPNKTSIHKTEEK